MRRQALRQRFSFLAISESEALTCGLGGALGGTRTPNLLIRSQMLYPLSYERTTQQYTAVRRPTVRANGVAKRTPWPDLLTASAARCPEKPSFRGERRPGSSTHGARARGGQEDNSVMSTTK